MCFPQTILMTITVKGPWCRLSSFVVWPLSLATSSHMCHCMVKLRWWHALYGHLWRIWSLGCDFQQVTGWCPESLECCYMFLSGPLWHHFPLSLRDLCFHGYGFFWKNSTRRGTDIPVSADSRVMSWYICLVCDRFSFSGFVCFQSFFPHARHVRHAFFLMFRRFKWVLCFL